MATTNITKFYIALDGTLVKQVNTSITRGGDSVNQMQFITPFDTSFTMEQNFQLANGEIVSSKPLTLRGTEELDIGSIYDGETWNIKGYDVESAVLSTLSKLVASPLYTSAIVKEQNPHYLGSYADETAILAITGMIDEDYVFNQDTDTSWEYDLDTTTWSDLLFEKTIYSSTTSIPASTIELSVNPSIISSSEEISQSAVELLTAWLNDVETELAKLRTQADGNFEPTNDDVWSSDKRIQTLLDNYYMAIADYDTNLIGGIVDKAETLDNGTNSMTALEGETVVSRVDQDVKTTSSPTFVAVNTDKVDFGTREITDNSTDSTLDLKLNANVTLQIGQEEVVYAYNAGSTITDGKVVYISGATGNRPTVALASNVTKATAHATIGISTEALTTLESHFVTTRGFVRGLDTSSFSEGDQLYLGVDGVLVNVEPTAPTYKVEVGTCITSNAGSGIVYVNVEKLHILGSSSDVYADSPVEGDLLVRDANDRYINKNIETIEFVKTGWDLDVQALVSISFDDATRTFTVAKTSATVDYWQENVKYTLDTALTVVIDDTEGLWFIYIVDGVLTASQTAWDLRADNAIPVSVVNWDATNKEAVAIAYELHSWLMSGVDHFDSH
ncbi:MAG: hypothetical protein GQ557_02585, partial [Mycoplasmataceae bacterium]|nr:hypothetical protein [Mycoplasmataceae bacterium]